MSRESYQLTGIMGKLGPVALGIGALGLAGCIVGYIQDSHGFFFGYLTSFSFFTALALGALFFVLVQHITKAAWSVPVRRIAENLLGTFPLLLLLILPLLGGLHELYHWVDEEHVAHDTLLQAKSAYLNLPFFLIRTFVFFGSWIWLGHYLRTTSVKQDSSGDFLANNRMAKWSTLGLAVYAVSETFFAFDWMMSLDAHWYSTMYGVYYFAGSAVAIHALLIVVSFLLQKTGNLKQTINVEHYHDMGKLLFGFNVFWAYVGFSQFMLIWYATIPEETLFFAHRAEGAWKTVSLMLPWGHFAVPFLFLLSRNVKRKLPLLFIGAIWLLIMCYIDIYWLVMPNHYHHGPHFGFTEIGSFLFIGGLFVFVFLWYTKRHALIPVKDPRLPDALHYSN